MNQTSSFNALRFDARLVALGVLVFACLGCSEATQREGMVKIKGLVQVDGAPAEGVLMTLHPQTGDASISTGTTGEDGSLQISTYTLGDGAPAGDYIVTFTWGKYDRVKRAYLGDELGGRYASPKKSEVVWKVSAGEEFDAGTIDLKR